MWAPLGTVNHTATWHPEPTFRGTWGLLTTALSTIGLCIWTAVHLNIPQEGKFMRQFWRKVEWLFIGLLAPEIICFIAISQWRRHRELQGYMEKALGGLQPPEESKRHWWDRVPAVFGPKDPQVIQRTVQEQSLQSPSESGLTGNTRRFRWTKTHSFFALMGGFAFDLGQLSEDFPLPENMTRLTLSQTGIYLLAKVKPDLIPDISALAIKDKSKSAGVGKVIAFWQALWFCVQFFNRLSKGLSISLIELNTFVHCVCAFIIYFIFWWNKPLDIGEPHLIPVTKTDRETKLICAAMCARSRIGRYPCELGSQRTRKPLVKAYAYARLNIQEQEENAVNAPEPAETVDDSGTPELAHEDPDIASQPGLAEMVGQVHATEKFQESSPRVEILLPQNEPRPQIGSVGTFTLTGEELQNGFFLDSTYALRWGFPISRPKHLFSLQITESMQKRCQLEKQGLLQYEDLRDWNSDSLNLARPFGESDLLVARAKNLPEAWSLEHLYGSGYDEVFEGNQSSTFAAFLLTSFLYGGIHLLLAWYGPINSKAEVTLWRISCLILLAPCAAQLGFLVLSGSWDIIIALLRFFVWDILLGYHLFRHYIRMISPILGLVETLMDLAWRLLYRSFPALSLFARVFIVVECVISLPFAPESVFMLPSWSVYLPHVS